LIFFGEFWIIEKETPFRVGESSQMERSEREQGVESDERAAPHLKWIKAELAAENGGEK
jgi:hypothetical protein